MTNDLGNRMKERYEDRTRTMLPRRTYTIIRVDGKAFHTYTRHCIKPFDAVLAQALDYAAIKLCEEAQGSAFAYMQSDEISVLLTDFTMPNTDAWFDGNLQKIVSVSASIVTATFGRHFNAMKGGPMGDATFDARAFTVADPVEVENYFIWRQQDATRNSIQSLAQAHYSHGQLHGLNTQQLQDLLHDKGVNWNDAATYWKRGRTVVYGAMHWTVDRKVPIFTQNREYLTARIPTARIPRIWSDALTAG